MTGQIGTEACKQSVGSEEDKVVVSAVDIAKQVGAEGDKVVRSADDKANVGRKDRWSRVANGKGKGIASRKRDRDSSSGRGSCRKSIGVHGKAYETHEENEENRDQDNNPERSLNMSVIIDSVVSGGQANDDNTPTTNNDPRTPNILFRCCTK